MSYINLFGFFFVNSFLKSFGFVLICTKDNSYYVKSYQESFWFCSFVRLITIYFRILPTAGTAKFNS